MNSFILVSQNPEKRKEYIEKFCLEAEVSPFDRNTIQTENPSIGIEIIRDLQKTLYFKPLKGEKKIIVIENAQTLTIEAQNALLKILEEPPVYTYFFLSASIENVFLSTILSRCKVIVLEEERTTLSREKEEEYLTDFQHLIQNQIVFKLSLAEKLASEKAKTQEWLEGMIYVLHKKMLENPEKSREVADVLERLQEAYRIFQTTNVNLRLLLEHTFLEFT